MHRNRSHIGKMRAARTVSRVLTIISREPRAIRDSQSTASIYILQSEHRHSWRRNAEQQPTQIDSGEPELTRRRIHGPGRHCASYSFAHRHSAPLCRHTPLSL